MVSLSSSHRTCMSCALILPPSRSQADMYRSSCSQVMAVQWLSHQPGLAAPAGCSGGLEERKRKREREIKESWFLDERGQSRMNGERSERRERKIWRKEEGSKVETWDIDGICRPHVSNTNVCSRLCLPRNCTCIFARRADSVLTDALRLKTTPGEVGQTGARNGALQ